jgi:hypothetical protein
VACTPFYFDNPAELSDLGTNARRHQWNVGAITRLLALDEQQTDPTREEQLELAHYTANGSGELIQRAVKVVRGKITPIEDYAGLISDAEATTMMRGALTQFFTPLQLALIIGRIADLATAGVERPRILEPATGIGMLIGSLSRSLRERSSIVGVELDRITSRIFAKLHPDIRFFAAQGFEDVELPEDSFDLTFSNVPFGSVKVTDPMFTRSERKLTGTLHDFFISKMMKLTRPGGFVVVLTSYGTMDKKTKDVRQWLASQGKLALALRLPNGMFAANSGSMSGCDLLVFQKYVAGEAQDLNPAWVESRRCVIPRGTNFVNAVTSQVMDYDTETMLGSLFTPGSSNVLGEYVSFQKGDKAYYVINAQEESLESLVETRLAEANLSPVVPQDGAAAALDELLNPTSAANSAPEDISSREAAQYYMELFEGLKNSRHQARLEAARRVFTAYKRLVQAEQEYEDDEEPDRLRAELNVAYDEFKVFYGCFNSETNIKVLAPVILEYPVLLSLEVNATMVGSMMRAEKAAIFAQRVSAPRKRPTFGNYSLDEALIWCLAERVKVDIHYIAYLAGLTPDEVVDGLQGRIYREIDAARISYVVKDELCSGNVRSKLAKARRLASIYPVFEQHVTALEAALPAPLTSSQISIELGNALVGPEMVSEFIDKIVPSFRSEGGSVEFHESMNAWKITTPKRARASREAVEMWATKRRNFFDIFDAAIHQRELVVRDEWEDAEGKKHTRINPQDTAEANVVLNRVKAEFVTWLWSDMERTALMERRYNEERNSHVERRYDGSHLHLVGLNTAGLRLKDGDPHQKDVIWRVLSTHTTYIAHPVGSGKTLMMIGGMNESIRRGLARKVLVCVPNSIIGQWAADFLRFYPAMRVLAMTKKDFEKKRRQRFLALAATGAWDVVVVGVTTFTRLPLPKDVRRAFYTEEIESLRAYLHDIYNADGGSEKKRDKALKRIEARVEKLEAKLKAIDAAIVRDDDRIANLAELGFDMLVIDEFHLFKNLVRR